MELTHKQQVFCDAYLKSGNATQAAIEAGYSEATARSIGSENLTKPDIAAYIRERSEKAADKRIMTAQQRQQMLSHIAVSGSHSDAIRAIDTLNKMTGEYLIKAEVTHRNEGMLADILEQLKE